MAEQLQKKMYGVLLLVLVVQIALVCICKFYFFKKIDIELDS